MAEIIVEKEWTKEPAGRRIFGNFIESGFGRQVNGMWSEMLYNRAFRLNVCDGELTGSAVGIQAVQLTEDLKGFYIQLLHHRHGNGIIDGDSKDEVADNRDDLPERFCLIALVGVQNPLDRLTQSVDHRLRNSQAEQLGDHAGNRCAGMRDAAELVNQLGDVLIEAFCIRLGSNFIGAGLEEGYMALCIDGGVPGGKRDPIEIADLLGDLPVDAHMQA